MSDGKDKGRYLRVYFDRLERNHPTIWFDPTCLSTFIRLLALSEKAWPAMPELPVSARRADLDKLRADGMIELLPNHRFALNGWVEERTGRADAARASVGVRWANDPKVPGGKRVSKKVRFQVLERDAFTCRYCGRKAAEASLDVDHIIPVHKGGTDDPSNLVAACADCNTGKSSHTLTVVAPSSNDRNTTVSPSNDDGDTARAPASFSFSSSNPKEEEPARDGYPNASSDRDSLDTYHELTRWRPWGAWSGKALNKAIEDFGDPAVDAALRSAHDDDPDRDTLMDRAFAKLARDAEKARASKPRPRVVRPVRDEAAIAAAKRELLGGVS